MRFPMSIVLVILCGVSASEAGSGQSPFAVIVHDYSPAPGQFVSDTRFDNPVEALGAPNGAGTRDGNAASVVSLGGFGGSITLGFDHTVEDDPLNPFGVDAIVYGNAIWMNHSPQQHWAECATIEISLDVNGNGLPDDPWYLIPGSHIVARRPTRTTMTWDDNVDDATYPPTDSSWLPPGAFGVWTTAAYALPASVFGATVVVNPASGTSVEAIYGYADYSPTLVLGDLNGDNIVDDPSIAPEEFYTVPDDPLTVGITPGSGGGDAFDIAWAIDPATGEPAHLRGFDFIRLTTAVDSVSPVFGEKSAEIDAVADVAPDPFGDADDDDDIDLEDIAWHQNCFGAGASAASPCERMDRNGDEQIDLRDSSAFIARVTGPK